LRILLIWPHFYPDLSGVACAKRGEAFAKYCSKKGIKVHVIAPKSKNVSTTGIKYENYEVNRVKTYDTVRESYSFLISMLYFPFSIRELITRVKEIKPDLIISSTPGPFIPFEGLLTAKYLKIPYIFYMADSWHLTRHSHKGILRKYLKMLLERVCATYSDYIFVVTPTLKQIISEGYNIHQDKLKVVYNGVDLNSFPKLEKNEIYDLVHLGSPRFYYDTVKLIDSFSIIVHNYPEIKLIFLGCTTEIYVKKVKLYAEEKGLLDNIEFVPIIPYEKVPYELSKAKIGIISLIDRAEYKSAIGVKVYEYMAAGLPTAYLGPSNSEQEKIIIDNDIGVSSSNITDFAEKVIHLMKNKKTRDIMGENARICVKKYSWENIINKTIDEHINPLASNRGKYV